MLCKKESFCPAVIKNLDKYVGRVLAIVASGGNTLFSFWKSYASGFCSDHFKGTSQDQFLRVKEFAEIN